MLLKYSFYPRLYWSHSKEEGNVGAIPDPFSLMEEKIMKQNEMPQFVYR